MPRWKQRFVCLACCHSAWREVETDIYQRPPDPTKLEVGGFYCSMCGARQYRVHQCELLAGRWTDAFKPGGMRLGLMTFELSAGRDVEVLSAVRKERAARHEHAGRRLIKAAER